METEILAALIAAGSGVLLWGLNLLMTNSRLARLERLDRFLRETTLDGVELDALLLLRQRQARRIALSNLAPSYSIYLWLSLLCAASGVFNMWVALSDRVEESHELQSFVSALVLWAIAVASLLVRRFLLRDERITTVAKDVRRLLTKTEK